MLRSYKNACGVAKDGESPGLKDFGVLLETAEAALGAIFGILMRISGMALEIADGVLEMALEAA